MISFVAGLTLGYVALRDWSEGAGVGLGALLGMVGALGTLLGSGWALKRLRSALTDGAEQRAGLSQQHVERLRQKLLESPELGHASSGLSIASNCSGGELSPSDRVGQLKQSTGHKDSLASQPNHIEEH